MDVMRLKPVRARHRAHIKEDLAKVAHGFEVAGLQLLATVGHNDLRAGLACVRACVHRNKFRNNEED